jgi:glycosyltransferase involved in cell wall biosynthesis
MPRPRLLFLVTEDWYFVSHRLPMARAAQSAGFEVHVATQVTHHGAAITAEGFSLHALDWSRKTRGLSGLIREILAIAKLYRTVRPALVHHVALKPVIFGQIAATGMSIASVNMVAGLGSSFIGRDVKAKAMRFALSLALRTLLNRARAITVVQNKDDYKALIMLGIWPESIRLVAGSGVDTVHLTQLPEPEGPITVGIAARMLEDKGIRPLVAAQALLHARGKNIRLLLAGDPDPANRSSIPERDMAEFASRQGVEWLGHVENIRDLWARCHIAALPSRREGLPKSLLEAAAFGRPIIATDVPGCRDVGVQNENAILVPVDDATALADAIEQLADDKALRERFGKKGRERVETLFSATAIGDKMIGIYKSLVDLPIEGEGSAV